MPDVIPGKRFDLPPPRRRQIDKRRYPWGWHQAV